jgi:hypothetical protein
MIHRIERELDRRLEGRRRRSICSIDMDSPEPDPAIGEAARQNAEVGRKAIEFSERVYEEGKPRQAKLDALVDQVIQQQLRLGDKSEAQADDYHNYMKSTFRPLEQSLAKDAMEFDTEAKRAELAGKAGADVEQAAGASDAAARRDAARYGVNASDAAFTQNLAGNALNKTILKVGAMSQARTQARGEGRALKFDAAGLGRNLPGAGATSTQLAIGSGSSAVGNAAAPAANARADASSVMAGYGTGVGATTAGANLYANLYGAKMQTDAAKWGGLGTLAGMGAYALLSSKKAKTKSGAVDPEKVAEKVKTLPVDRWRYKTEASPDQAEHVGPYAEDFAKRFGVGDGKTISIIDAVGVTLAAVKGLAQKVDRIESGARAARRGVAV